MNIASRTKIICPGKLLYYSSKQNKPFLLICSIQMLNGTIWSKAWFGWGMVQSNFFKKMWWLRQQINSKEKLGQIKCCFFAIKKSSQKKNNSRIKIATWYICYNKVIWISKKSLIAKWSILHLTCEAFHPVTLFLRQIQFCTCKLTLKKSILLHCRMSTSLKITRDGIFGFLNNR